MKRKLIFPKSRPADTQLFVCDGCGVAIWSAEKPLCVLPMCRHRETRVREATRDEVVDGEARVAA